MRSATLLAACAAVVFTGTPTPAQGPAFKINEVRILLKDADTKNPLVGVPTAFEYWTPVLGQIWHSDKDGWLRPGIIYPDAIPNILPSFKVWALINGEILGKELTLPPWNNKISPKPLCKNCRNILFYEWRIDLKSSLGGGQGGVPPKPSDCDKWTTEIISGPDAIPCECSSTHLFCVTITKGRAPDQRKRVRQKLQVTLTHQAGAAMSAQMGGFGLNLDGRRAGKTADYSKEVEEEVNLGTEDYDKDVCGRECLSVMQVQLCVRSAYYGCVLVGRPHGRRYWKKYLVQAGDPYPIRIPTGLCVGLYRWDCSKGPPKPGSDDDPCKDFRITADTCKKQ